MTTQNVSADKNGCFSTREKAETEKEKWIRIIEENIKNSTEETYYATDIKYVEFDIREIVLDSGID